MPTMPWKYKIIDISGWTDVKPGFFSHLYDDLEIRMVIFRVGIGSTIDAKFRSNYDQAKAEAPSLLIGGYYVPGEIYSVQANLNYFKAFVGFRQLDLVAVDAEIPILGGTYAMLRNVSIGLYLEFQKAYGDLATYFYSSPYKMRLMGASALWSKINQLWIAGYYSSIPNNHWWPDENSEYWGVIPYGLDYELWQFFAAFKTNSTYSRSSLDANVGYGEMDELFAQEPEPEPDPDPEPEEPFIYSYQILTASLNVRSGPGTEFPYINFLKQGQLGWISRFDVDSSDRLWAEIAPNSWACANTPTTKFMEVFESQFVVVPPKPEPEPEPEPEPPAPNPIPEEEIGLVEVRGKNDEKPWSVAWGLVAIANGFPIMELNVFVSSHDDKYKFPKGTELTVFKEVTTADGGEKFHQIHGMEYRSRPVYLKKAEMMKKW